jgi:hypothetical protein
MAVSFSFPQPILIFFLVVGGLLLLALLPFLATALWIYFSSLWVYMIKSRSRYLKLNSLRHKWNKTAMEEERRQAIAECWASWHVSDIGQSVEHWLLLRELVRKRAVYFLLIEAAELIILSGSKDIISRPTTYSLHSDTPFAKPALGRRSSL